jgi:hypothetical protein
MSVTVSTGQNIIDRVRYVINDTTSASYRFTEAELLLWITDGQREIVRRIPRAYVTGGAQHTGVAVPDPGTATTGNLSINPILNGALVNYVLFRAYSKDGEMANTEQAALHLKLFEAELERT